MIYTPLEDSYLLAEEIKKYIELLDNKNISVLDMGSGSGIQAEACIKAGIPKKKILLADVDKEAITELRKKGFNAVYSDLFSDIQERFDLIIFNPPYLPESEFDRGKDTTGGKNGYETALRFLRQAQEHLNKDGRIFIVFSSLAGLKKNLVAGYRIKEAAKKRLFFEELIVWELSI